MALLNNDKSQIDLAKQQCTQDWFKITLLQASPLKRNVAFQAIEA